MSLKQLIFMMLLVLPATLYAQNPVVTTRPRILLTPEILTALKAKKTANDAEWKALKQTADEHAGWPIISPYSNKANFQYQNDKINYYYQGSRWLEVTMSMALAFQITGDTRYSDKLKLLADVIISGEGEPVKEGLGYAARNVGMAVAIIYDWCYDELTADQRGKLVNIMKEYYKFLRKNNPSGEGGHAYQNSYSASGNYFFGHVSATAYMGYALAGDEGLSGDMSITANEMIAWARQRFDGKIIYNLPANTNQVFYRASDWVKQTFDGGYPSLAGRDTDRAEDMGSPCAGGVHVQGFSYGADVFSAYIDYAQLVKTSTGEDLFIPNQHWWIAMFKTVRHSLLPNGWNADEAGDNGTNYHIQIRQSLPYRLAYVLKGTSYGPQIQHFLKNELRTGNKYDETPVPLEAWERVYYSAPQTATPSNDPPYYSGFNNGYNQGKGNGAMPYFLMRNKWGTEGTWLAFQASPASFDDHDHFNAGNIDINFKGEYILSSPSDNNYGENSAASSTLFIDDRGDFQSKSYRSVGGQFTAGRNQIMAAMQNDSLSYVRADLTTAYNRDPDNLVSVPANRKLDYFIRSFVYLRPSNIVVVYDQTSVKNPASGNPYRRHIRWHFANGAAKPTVTGRRIKALTATSTLNIHTVLPVNSTTVFIDQRKNPDGASFSDKSPFESDTWRAEVAGDNSQQDTDYLSVLQPGDKTLVEMETAALFTSDGLLQGVLIMSQGKKRNDLVFFSKEDKALQTAITSTVLPIAGAGQLYYTVVSAEPNAVYRISVDNNANTVALQKDASGTLTSDAAGVVRFSITGNNPVNGDPDPDRLSISVYVPNLFSPNNDGQNETFRVQGDNIATISLKVFNTFGQEVFGTTDVNIATGPGWNGTLNGTPQPAGIYIWKISGTHTDGKPFVIKNSGSGQLMLVR